MNTFIGDETFFYQLISGYARNTTRDITTKYKSGVCACCGAKGKEIESAHKRGCERSDLVKQWIKESILKKENSVCHINVDKFNELFKNFTRDLSNFYFLCHDCHSKYDNAELNETDFKHISESIKQKRQKSERKRTVVAPSAKLNKEYIVHGKAYSGKEFESFLRSGPCTVYVTLFYTDKTQSQHVWYADKFSPKSSLSGNLHSGYLRNWDHKGITGIQLEIK